MEKNSNSEKSPQELEEQKQEKKKQELLAKFQEEERKTKNRADVLYGSDEEYYKKNPHRNYQQFEGNMTGGAASIVTDEIAGVTKGEPKSLDEAVKGTNPNYKPYGNITYRVNCQASVAVAEARMRGFDIEVSIPYLSELKTQLATKPNIAFIDPKTGKTPEFTILKLNDEYECDKWLNDNIKPNERYVFTFQWKQKSYDNRARAHIIIATKNENNNLILIDPQTSKEHKNPTEYLHRIQYKFNWSETPFYPKILRVDDKELNKKILDQISKPTKY